MKTTLKRDWDTEPKTCQINRRFQLGALENEAEITAIIQEAEALLESCFHCGGKPMICYAFAPGDEFPKRIDFDTGVAVTEHPHKLYGGCNICGIRTQKWHAEDDEADFKEALRLIVEAWNRRPA